MNHTSKDRMPSLSLGYHTIDLKRLLHRFSFHFTPLFLCVCCRGGGGVLRGLGLMIHISIYRRYWCNDQPFLHSFPNIFRVASTQKSPISFILVIFSSLLP